MSKAQELRDKGYRDAARDARQDNYNPSRQYQTSKNYREGYQQGHIDHHKIGPAPKPEAPHLRPVL